MDEDKPEVKTDHEYSKLEAISLLNLLNKYVKVNVLNCSAFEGFIQSIDPTTYSLILAIPKNSTFKTVVIPGHGVTEVTEINPADHLVPPIKTSECIIEGNNTLDRKTTLLSWFKQNLLPVTEANENIVFGNVKILPPYSVDDICTDNTVVAIQIRKLIKQMP